jgi:hypothetical protein
MRQKPVRIRRIIWKPFTVVAQMIDPSYSFEEACINVDLQIKCMMIDANYDYRSIKGEK